MERDTKIECYSAEKVRGKDRKHYCSTYYILQSGSYRILYNHNTFL